MRLWLVTILVTLWKGVEAGLIAGVGLSIFLHLYRTSRPHVAVLGQVPGTEHFLNVKRHEVITDPGILSIRVDASLYFPNARFLEDTINNAVAENPDIKHLILVCPAVNTIDLCPGKPRGNQPEVKGQRNKTAPVRSQGPRHGQA